MASVANKIKRRAAGQFADGVPFWKSVGGYFTCVKVRGRWYYVGYRRGELEEMEKFARERGIKMTRVQGTPRPVVKIWEEHGANGAALVNYMPHWTPRVGLE